MPLPRPRLADDEAWSKRVGTLVQKALPVLGERIGLAWPRDDALIIQEAVSRSTGGYAGLFDPNSGLVEVAYYADDGVVLHEAAHGWFNGALLADRWANEAFASYYGLEAAKDLKVEGHHHRADRRAAEGRDPAQRLGPRRPRGGGHRGLRLRGVPRRSPGPSPSGPDPMGCGRSGRTRRNASGRTSRRWRAPPMPARATPTPSWSPGRPTGECLLDLLEARTPQTYDELWRTWVARAR